MDVTAVILCGGKGERLRPLTDVIPKPLVPLRGRPILRHLMDYLYASGIGRFILCVGYKAALIEQFLQEHRGMGWQARCVDSGDAPMTVRLADARPYIAGRALVCYGDTLANVNLSALLEEHESHTALATVTVYPLLSPYGIVDMNTSGQVTGFKEKPRLPYWINIGFLLLEPAALNMVSRDEDMPAYLERLAASGRMRAFRHEGKHLTVNTETERKLAEKEIVSFYTLPEQGEYE
ncbi:MAG: sugar phosphate nucleotidyltransferase [Gemmatales bacterium]|nr:sugar phosphate nucleotidyltransferase [Gemmatales bacterium]MDW8387190.1 sugar phosphate nucleotidyltransferase [Gemmatales bacterium]